MALRNSLMAKVWDALERSPFTPLDFSISPESRNYLLEVTFNHQPSFRFLVSRSSSKGSSLTMAPGAHETSESMVLESLDRMPDLLLQWTRFIRDELRTTVPVYAAVDELRESLERHINEHVENPQSPFNEDEVSELKEKLDNLSRKFSEMQESHDLTQQEVNKLNQEISSIKANLDAYPKGVWYKTAANKLWIAVSKVATSRESRQIIAQAAQKVLGLDP